MAGSRRCRPQVSIKRRGSRIYLDRDITIANPGWMIIGRQVDTGFGSRVDLVAIDAVGDLVLLELKRDRTPREVIAQVLEYGAWVVKLRAEDIAQIYRRYVERFHPDRGQESFDQAFIKRFSVKEVPEDLNQAHELVVVASQFDATSERIVQYLAEEHEVGINAIFFRVFKDGDREYLARAWLRDPSEVDVDSASCCQGRVERRVLRFLRWRSRLGRSSQVQLHQWWRWTFLQQDFVHAERGNRVWINIPGTGYVGVGVVEEPVVPIEQFLVKGDEWPDAAHHRGTGSQDHATVTRNSGDPDKGEYLVRVKWLKTVDEAHAIKERGFFGNQNTVAKPRADSWRHTVERLKAGFGISD